MKTEKVIRSFFAARSSGQTNGMIALIAGLAAGAVLGVLFAPENGASARKKLREAAGKFFGNDSGEELQQEQTGPDHISGTKRPKSDIKALVHRAHSHASHTEQGLIE